MADRPVIEVDRVWKSYRAYEQKASTLKETILKRRSRYHDFWALRDISLSVGHGDMLGVIGSNGSGKSTLLKCLARIIAPNYGRVVVEGKVSALLELGTGFHQELTGRENVYLAGSILGQNRRQLDARFDEIVAFSGLGDFIDSPVKNYSSGMYARLAFAVAINVDPEVLLIDEVLAVGDQEFQDKCHDRLFEFRQAGVPIVFVSHALDSVRNLCNRVAWLEKGRLRAIGGPHEVIDEYLDEVRRNQVEAGALKLIGQRYGTREIELQAIEFLDRHGREKSAFEPGEPMTLRFKVDAAARFDEVVLAYSVHRDGGGDLTGINTLTHGLLLRVDEGPGIVEYTIDSLPLYQGGYHVTALLHDVSGFTTYDCRQLEFGFTVMSGGLGHGEGLVYFAGKWRTEGGVSGMGVQPAAGPAEAFSASEG
jgi:ABC-type polysaccharide/polyol phosphate transport system ATPase subunit